MRSRRIVAVLRRAEGLLLGLGAGALFGVSNVAIKFLTHAEGPIHELLSPWTLTALLAGAISFYASARSLQLGPAVEVMPVTSGRQPPRHHRRRPRQHARVAHGEVQLMHGVAADA